MKEALPISELEELSLSGLLPERLVVCVRARVRARVGWCIVVAAALEGIASSLHSSRKSGGSGGKNEWKLIGICCVLGIICSLLWTGVFCSGRCVPFQESTAQGVE